MGIIILFALCRYAHSRAFISVIELPRIPAFYPKYLVPDNLKTAITRHTKDELVINSAYQDLENFYDVVILPPPPRKPKGKPTVEKYVQFLETHLLEDLKEKVYYSIEDINRDVNDLPVFPMYIHIFYIYIKSFSVHPCIIITSRWFIFLPYNRNPPETLRFRGILRLDTMYLAVLNTYSDMLTR